ncbi:4-alpha-glucanotransferase [Palleronia aestuarii]|uniref:4-alpha-glucanotransferase n=1 Tax=Palleronia aestuarii TaxID=568105 RepID=A0A2W7NLI3_9RHOB|nr:4-alpha-glucanotransferase [Palleronia aestuarii]PZX17534.1 4-alpha-glucanotransferase [Palleronia aestuarii]
MIDPRDDLAGRLGIVPEYRDATGTVHEISALTRDALLEAMGVPTGPVGAARHLEMLKERDAGRPIPDYTIVDVGSFDRIESIGEREWEILLEDGSTRRGSGGELGELPLGVHEIRCEGATGWILCAPARLPEPPRCWGVTLPLYGIGRDGAIGTYADLAEAVGSLGRAGAAFVGVNPIHAGFPADPNAISPYSPSHRGRLSTIYIAAEEAGDGDDAALIDYGTAIPIRMKALEAEWRRASSDDARDWRRDGDADLQRFCLHQALSERFGSYWPAWPEEYRSPDTEASKTFAEENAERLDFHAWLQRRADRQLAEVEQAAKEAGMTYGLYLDLAVGTHPAGAETWGDAELFARDVSLGAPPDAFSSDGQSWGLAPLRPDTLIAEGFRPLSAILRRQLAHAKILRIDHILGFDRAFWVPVQDGIPGAYVRMPRDALLAVARIEAARAGAVIVGEDLGNIPDGLQQALRDAGILGCRVVQFEQHWEHYRPSFRDPEHYTTEALTSFSTHDLPTWLGWREGRDIDWRRDLGSMDVETHRQSMEKRREEVETLDRMLQNAGVDAMHRFVGSTTSRLVALQIEDILGKVEQPNLPGTVDDHPNWRRRVGEDAGTLGRLDAVKRTAQIMSEVDR